MIGGAWLKLRVGEVARRSGVTVRTLHHYEALGLLGPVGRSAAGYRLYDAANIEQLHQVCALRHLGFGLHRIRSVLDRNDHSLLETIDRHLNQLQDEVARRQRLIARLEWIAKTLRSNGAVSIDEILTAIEEMTKVDAYYTAEQLAELEARRSDLGEEGMRAAEKEWATLIDEVRAEMANGTDPTSERVRSLAARWQALVNAFTGDNPEIAASLQRMWQQESTVHAYNTAEMRQLGAYLAKAADS